eukprot:COSAG04_NODE_29934_length_265_cov_1.415663_1_plen_72_part_01
MLMVDMNPFSSAKSSNIFVGSAPVDNTKTVGTVGLVSPKMSWSCRGGHLSEALAEHLCHVVAHRERKFVGFE